MTQDDDQWQRMFAGISFPDEPAETASVDEDVRRARQSFVKRRVKTWGAAALGTAVIASGVAVAAPNLGLGDNAQLPVAENSDESDNEQGIADPDGKNGADVAATADVNTCPADPPVEDPTGLIGFPSTRACLLQIATKHFDPEGIHLPEQATNLGTGGGADAMRVSSKLDWVVPGEDGLGMVQVAVTTPGFADDEHAAGNMPGVMVCGEQPDVCRTEPVPDTGDEVLVVEDDPEYGWALGVLYERPDGSMVSVAVNTLFGNNSLVPVSDVDITLEQAIAFVTDPDLRIDEAEIAEAEEAWAREMEQAAGDPDFSSTEVVPAPASRDMMAAEAQAALDACVAGVPEWRDFEPEFGVWLTTPSGEEEPFVIAERGDTKMECRDRGAGLFGTPEVKGSPYLRGAASYNSMTFGRYISDVERVTVQFSGGPQHEAVMKNGYWFLPEELMNGEMAAIRGLDAAGEVIYDSTDVDPDACYADPDGTEIIYAGGDENADVADCIPMLEWDQ